jgi:hypothetical protein
MMAKSRAARYAINKPSEESWDTILTLSSITPVGMGREADDASDVVIRVAVDGCTCVRGNSGKQIGRFGSQLRYCLAARHVRRIRSSAPS